jgi:hypothetical protein
VGQWHHRPLLRLFARSCFTPAPASHYLAQVFYRERASLMYDPLATGLSVLLTELPYLGAQSILFTVLVYFLIDFGRTAEKFFFYLLMVGSFSTQAAAVHAGPPVGAACLCHPHGPFPSCPGPPPPPQHCLPCRPLSAWPSTPCLAFSWSRQRPPWS